uniref:NADH-ubiquinone oxidoreductase chain 4L n=1 Tax=Metaperipatus inae TaxID=444703 RepID=B3F5K9_9BILA|nr:NADH dehydrogenase subunit 4L [Metaperipatus inae]ABQ95567.1 NADH dehydrogenase subunit 4L [Metaperipatus inae]
MTLTPQLLVMIGCASFISKRSHILAILLSLEFIMLNMFWMMNIWLLIMEKEMFLSVVFLSITACEASIGLAILISMMRSHGNDYYNSLSIIL